MFKYIWIIIYIYMYIYIYICVCTHMMWALTTGPCQRCVTEVADATEEQLCIEAGGVLSFRIEGPLGASRCFDILVIFNEIQSFKISRWYQIAILYEATISIIQLCFLSHPEVIHLGRGWISVSANPTWCKLLCMGEVSHWPALFPLSTFLRCPNLDHTER